MNSYKMQILKQVLEEVKQLDKESLKFLIECYSKQTEEKTWKEYIGLEMH